MNATVKIGDRVSYAESGQGRKWTKIGVVVEFGPFRCRVQWEKWIFTDGEVRLDSKRTWVKISRCVAIAK